MESFLRRLKDLNPLRSQVLMGATKIGLLPRGIWSNFLEQANESKILGHERNEQDEACFKELHLERKDKNASRDIVLRAIEHIQSEKGCAGVRLEGFVDIWVNTSFGVKSRSSNVACLVR